MISSVKKALFKLLPQKAYLRSLHRGFYLLYGTGRLKNRQAFKYHYLVRDIIEEDFTVVDIGANLGYFAKTFARLTPKGRVVCVEPIPDFYEILKWALGKYPNVKIVNCALGTEKGIAKMVLPQTDGVMRTGLPHIASEDEKRSEKTVEVPLEKGSELLSGLSRIDYLKCDIEGFEAIVFNEMKDLLADKKPIIQVEIAEKNEAEMLSLFRELGYIQYGAAGFKIVRDNGSQKEHGDFLFVHETQSGAFERKMQGKGLFGA
jgi:FkbM family methyltransferase